MYTGLLGLKSQLDPNRISMDVFFPTLLAVVVFMFASTDKVFFLDTVCSHVYNYCTSIQQPAQGGSRPKGKRIPATSTSSESLNLFPP